MSAGNLQELVALAMPCEWCGVASRRPCVEWGEPIEGFHKGDSATPGRLAASEPVLAEVRAWLASKETLEVAAEAMVRHRLPNEPIQQGDREQAARALAVLIGKTKED